MEGDLHTYEEQSHGDGQKSPGDALSWLLPQPIRPHRARGRCESRSRIGGSEEGTPTGRCPGRAQSAPVQVWTHRDESNPEHLLPDTGGCAWGVGHVVGRGEEQSGGAQGFSWDAEQTNQTWAEGWSLVTWEGTSVGKQSGKGLKEPALCKRLAGQYTCLARPCLPPSVRLLLRLLPSHVRGRGRVGLVPQPQRMEQPQVCM